MVFFFFFCETCSLEISVDGVRKGRDTRMEMITFSCNLEGPNHYFFGAEKSDFSVEIGWLVVISGMWL